jgi:hypothetical protein
LKLKPNALQTDFDLELAEYAARHLRRVDRRATARLRMEISTAHLRYRARLLRAKRDNRGRRPIRQRRRSGRISAARSRAPDDPDGPFDLVLSIGGVRS